MQIKIDKLTISQKNPLIIPEIGINHNGSLEIAKLMVDAAKRAGAKIIKHQTHIVEDEMSQEAKMLYRVMQILAFMRLWNNVH